MGVANAAKLNLSDMIVKVVKEKRGMKPYYLCQEIRNRFRNNEVEVQSEVLEKPLDEVVNETVFNLVKDKKLVEVEYIIDMAVADSIILPARSAVNVRGIEA